MSTTNKSAMAKILNEWLGSVSYDYKYEMEYAKRNSHVNFSDDYDKTLFWAREILKQMLRLHELGFDIIPILDNLHADALNRLHGHPKSYDLTESIVGFLRDLKHDMEYAK